MMGRKTGDGMTAIRRTKSEYGGFLPLELNPGKEYFADYEPNLCRFNSVKAALDFLIKRLRQKKIYIPYYYCPSTTEAIKKTGIEVRQYHIKEDLTPVALPDEPESMVLLVDYFGVCRKKVKDLAKTFKKAEVTIDSAHGFYEEPVMAENIHNVYSAKKFFGIPDGAYLISEAFISHTEILTKAYGYAEYLLTSYEEGTNAAYQMKKNSDGILAANYGGMSMLAVGLLKNVDYDRIRKLREKNYRFLYGVFKDRNELKITENSAAYQFPLLIGERGKKMKEKLIADRIFVSTLWSGKDLLENGNAFELNMMENALFLPVDQRYEKTDMEYIADRVEAGLQCSKRMAQQQNREITIHENSGYDNP